MMNVLIVRTSSMGDLVHTYPAITELMTHYPNIALTWLAEEGFADIAALHPAVRQVIPMAWRRWRKQLTRPDTWREMRQFHRVLRGTPWDLVLDCQGLVKSAIPARLCGAPVAGYDRKSIREPLASTLYHHVHAVSRDLSAVERNRQLFARVFGYTVNGQPDFGIGKGERPGWAGQTGYAVFLHATSKASKEWPEAHWIALGKALAMPVWLPYGNDMEKARAERIAACLPDARVAPRMRLKEAAGLIGHATAVVGVDTGLTHLANAADVPLVAIYTDTDPARTGVVETPRAINLGGIDACPDVQAVLHALERAGAGR